jgi:hypothetical protein
MGGRAIFGVAWLVLGLALVGGCADSGGGADADGAVGPDVVADAGADADAVADGDAVAETDAGAVAETDAGADADAQTDADSSSDADAVSDADADADSDSDAHADSDSDADADADSDSDADADADSDSDADADSDSDADADADSVSDADPDAAPDADTSPDAVATPCSPNPCVNPPSASCSANSAVTYPATGTCAVNGTAATCDYAPATTDCGSDFCVAGVCVAWRLAGVGDLVITEIMHRPDAVFENLGEWFEVHSVADVPVNMKGLVVRDLGVDTFTIATDLIVAPDGYAVFGRNPNPAQNGGLTVDYAYANLMSLAAGDELILARDGATIDLVDWDSKPGFPNTLGASLNLDPGVDAAGNDAGAAWCSSKSPYGDGDFGTPGAPNDPCALILTPCTPNPCDAAPAASCAGETLSTFASPGTCVTAPAPAFFACTYSPLVTECADSGQHCDAAAGACVECVDDSHCAGPFEVCSPANGCVAGCQDDGFAGEDIENPAPIASNIQNDDLVICEGTEDWFGFDVEVGVLLQLAVTYDGAGAALEIELYDAAGAQVAAGTPGTNQLVIAFEVQAAGVHTLRVHGGPNAYSLLALFTDEQCVPDPCTANTPAPTCDGADRVTYDHECDESTGSAVCTYPEATRVTCPKFCNDGECTDWRLAQVPGDLVITELMVSPAATDELFGEYIELHNTSVNILNLDGLEVFDLGADSFFIDETLLVAPGDAVVLGRSDDVGLNGGVPVDFVYSGMTLEAAVDAVAIARGGVDIDDVIWDDAEFPATAGAAMSLDPSRGDALTNDYGVGWCDATSPLSGGDFGTPGAANDACVIDYPIDWCRLYAPNSIDTKPLTKHSLTGRVFINGLTTIDLGANDPVPARVFGEVGFGDVGTDPASDESWSWFAGEPDPSYAVGTDLDPEPDNDQYLAELVAPDADGSYEVAFRFSGDGGGTWTYCDANGTSGDGVEPYASADAGKLEVATPPPPTLIISEYVDGSPGTGNKAVELTNVGATAVDLSAAECSLRYYATPGTGVGAHTAVTFDVALVGSVSPGGSWLLCQSGITIFPLAKCQQSSSSTAWFNGDDPVELRCGGQSVDWIGQTGVDLDFALDVTLKRSCDVGSGDPVGTDAFSAAAEWLSLAQNTVSDLGVHEPARSATAAGGKELIIEAVDLVTQRLRLRNVSAVSVDVTSGWRLCRFPTYLAFTSSTVSIAAGASATFDIPAGMGLTAGGSWELGVYRNASNFGSEANIAAYVEVGAAGFTREGVAATAGVWTAGQFVTLDALTDAGFALVGDGVATGSAAYQPYGLFCSIK